jgi:hypothetical protein
MTQIELEKFDFVSFPQDTGIGFIFGVLKIPESLHDFMSDLPFPPERRKVKVSYLSPS